MLPRHRRRRSWWAPSPNNCGTTSIVRRRRRRLHRCRLRGDDGRPRGVRSARRQTTAPRVRVLGLAGGGTRRARRRLEPTPTCCSCSPHSSCCTRARWCTTTSSTPRRPAAGLPTVHRLFADRHRERNWHGSSEQFGAVDGDPARRPVAGLGRRHRHLRRPAARRPPPRPAGVGRHPDRGARRPVPRHRRRGQRCGDGGVGDERQHLQDRLLHGVAAAAARRGGGGRPARRAGHLPPGRHRPRRGLPAARRRARRVRRPRGHRQALR